MRGLLSPTALTLGLICALFCCDPALAEKRVALVIGNSAYQRVPALPNPVRDATAIAAMFENSGFAVVRQNNVTKIEFKRVVRQFADAAADADIAVIYYAGHGIEIYGTNYLIPVDAELAGDRDADDEAITLARLVEATDGARRLRFVILDACRENPFARTMKRQRASASAIHAGLGKVEPTGTNTLISVAAKTGVAALDGDGDHSPFAAALLDNLFVPGLDVRLALGRVRDAVMAKTGNRQEPFVYGSLAGTHFSLAPAAGQQPAATASQGEKGDYELVEKIGTKGAWEVFLAQHPKGFYAELAREQIARLVMAEGGFATPHSLPASSKQQVAALNPPSPTASGPASEEQREWDKVKNSGNAELFRAFIRRYPASPLANSAQSHLQAIEAAHAKAEREAALKPEEEQRQRKAAEAALAIAEMKKSSLPDFPWPPPAASSSYVLPKALFNDRATIGQLADAIISALESSGYVERSFFQTEANGIALVTRLERIQEDGAPWAGRERWPVHGAKYDTAAELLSFLRGLFYADPGRYRVIAFIIQEMPFSQTQRKVTGEEARGWLRSGANKLPPKTADRPLGLADCTALVYEFASDGTAVRVVQSQLTGKQHLERSGVMGFLQKPH